MTLLSNDFSLQIFNHSAASTFSFLIDKGMVSRNFLCLLVTDNIPAHESLTVNKAYSFS